MTAKSSAHPSLARFVPDNLTPGAKFCEEVFVNAAEDAYVRAPAAGHSLSTLAGQAAYVSAGNTIEFPTPSVELKVDWLPAASLDTPFIDCETPPDGLFVEEIEGVCYALVAMHISSKLYPNWGWATFEPQVAETNPNRCDKALYGECNDPWGASPATNGRGTKTTLTPAASALIERAGLPKAFANYRLTGTQVDDTVPQLGNSFVEFNAGVPAQAASCITCHAYAQLDPTGYPPHYHSLPGDPPIGTPAPIEPPWVTLDFSWMLASLR